MNVYDATTVETVIAELIRLCNEEFAPAGSPSPKLSGWDVERKIRKSLDPLKATKSKPPSPTSRKGAGSDGGYGAGQYGG